MNEISQKGGLRWRLRVIFLYYASYADRNNYKLLKTQNYRRFLIDSEAVVDHASFPPFDIAFRKLHASAITHNQFQELLPVISQMLYPNKNRKEGFQLFLRSHMEKLYHEIITQSQFGAEVFLIQSLKIESKSLELIDSIPLRKAYDKYIEKTSMHQKNPQDTFQQIHTFMNEFQLSPKLIYKALSYLVFFFLLKSKQNSRRYDLDDFKKLLICIAELNWRKTQNTDTIQEQKIYRMLQYMQLSAGFKRLANKILKENAVSVSFLKQIPNRMETQEKERLNDSRERSYLNNSRGKDMPRSTKNQNNSNYFSAKKVERREDLITVRQVMEGIDGEDNVNHLKQIFARLCSVGEVANTKTLKSIKIKKYFQNLNILSPLSQTWLDLMIIDLCRSSPSGKIQFSHFLQLLMIVSQKINISVQSLFQYMIEENSHSKSRQQQKKIVVLGIPLKIVYQVQKQLEKIFLHFSTGKRLLSFDQLTHLLFDFDIFPSFLSKTKLYQIFQANAKASSEVRKMVGEVTLDLPSFMDVLVEISNQIGQDLTPEERIIFLLQRMQDSTGHKTLMGGQGSNLIGDIRSRYASIYHSNVLKRSAKQQRQGFQDLIQDYQS